MKNWKLRGIMVAFGYIAKWAMRERVEEVESLIGSIIISTDSKKVFIKCSENSEYYEEWKELERRESGITFHEITEDTKREDVVLVLHIPFKKRKREIITFIEGMKIYRDKEVYYSA